MDYTIKYWCVPVEVTSENTSETSSGYLLIIEITKNEDKTRLNKENKNAK